MHDEAYLEPTLGFAQYSDTRCMLESNTSRVVERPSGNLKNDANQNVKLQHSIPKQTRFRVFQ